MELLRITARAYKALARVCVCARAILRALEINIT